MGLKLRAMGWSDGEVVGYRDSDETYSGENDVVGVAEEESENLERRNDCEEETSFGRVA
jgi:hypothetical protein